MQYVPGETRIGRYLLLRQIPRLGTPRWLARHTKTNLEVTIVVIRKSLFPDPESRSFFVSELSKVKEFRHPFIAEIFEIIEDLFATYVVGEYCPSLLSERAPLTEAQCRFHLSQLISVLDYLHIEKRVCHRDIRAEHVLFDRYNNIRVADFGLGLHLPRIDDSLASTAPEILSGHPYRKCADIWSLGIVLYEMATGRLPFWLDDKDQLRDMIATQDPSYKGLSDSLADLLRKMLTKNADARVTLDRIKEHYWFASEQFSGAFDAHVSSQREIETGVNTEIVGKIGSFSIDVRPLPEQILLGEWTPLTGAYRSLVKDLITENLKDLFQTLPKAARPTQPGLTFTMVSFTRRTMPVERTARPRPGAQQTDSESDLSKSLKQADPMRPQLPAGPRRLSARPGPLPTGGLRRGPARPDGGGQTNT